MNAEARPLELSFHATAKEYFRIWGVNVVLTVLTLGLYGPWAKVRSRQYFYGSTRLEGAPFHYDASPITILKGRLVSTALVAGYYVAIAQGIDLKPYALALAVPVLPWIVVRAYRFEAGHSIYRGRRFAFHGEYGSALRVGLGALLLALTGLGLPWAYCRVKSYLACHLGYGGVRGRLGVRGERLFKALMIAACPALASTALVVWMAVTWSGETPRWLPFVFALPMYLGWSAGRCLFQARATNLIARQAKLGSLRFRSNLWGRELLLLEVTNLLASVASLGLLIPWAEVRAKRYRVERLRVLCVGDREAFLRDASESAAEPGAGHALGTALAEELGVGA